MYKALHSGDGIDSKYKCKYQEKKAKDDLPILRIAKDLTNIQKRTKIDQLQQTVTAMSTEWKTEKSEHLKNIGRKKNTVWLVEA